MSIMVFSIFFHLVVIRSGVPISFSAWMRSYVVPLLTGHHARSLVTHRSSPFPARALFRMSRRAHFVRPTLRSSHRLWLETRQQENLRIDGWVSGAWYFMLMSYHCDLQAAVIEVMLASGNGTADFVGLRECVGGEALGCVSIEEKAAFGDYSRDSRAFPWTQTDKYVVSGRLFDQSRGWTSSRGICESGKILHRRQLGRQGGGKTVRDQLLGP